MPEQTVADSRQFRVLRDAGAAEETLPEVHSPSPSLASESSFLLVLTVLPSPSHSHLSTTEFSHPSHSSPLA
jgi:hypothetical protein